MSVFSSPVFLLFFALDLLYPKEEYFSFYSEWISQRKNEYFWSCSDWMQREIVRASSVLLPHLYNPPPLYTHILHSSFFKPKTKPWWTIIIEPPQCWGSLLWSKSSSQIQPADRRVSGGWNWIRRISEYTQTKIDTGVGNSKEVGRYSDRSKKDCSRKCFCKNSACFVFVLISVVCILVQIQYEQKIKNICLRGS